MKNPTKIPDQQRQEESAAPREQFVRQVLDDSLPAERILTEQQASRQPEDPAPLFVP